VVHTKPGPEPYLKAALALGVEPASAFVIENAPPLGIQSAKAAGMICMALTTTLAPADLSAVDTVFNSQAILIRVLTAQLSKT
jgi:beta-phosphoglucomutase